MKKRDASGTSSKENGTPPRDLGRDAVNTPPAAPGRGCWRAAGDTSHSITRPSHSNRHTSRRGPKTPTETENISVGACHHPLGFRGPSKAAKSGACIMQAPAIPAKPLACIIQAPASKTWPICQESVPHTPNGTRDASAKGGAGGKP